MSIWTKILAVISFIFGGFLLYFKNKAQTSESLLQNQEVKQKELDGQKQINENKLTIEEEQRKQAEVLKKLEEDKKNDSAQAVADYFNHKSN